MKILEVNAQEFESIASLEPNGNIFQSCINAEVLKAKGYEPLFLEYLNDNGVAEAFASFSIKKDSFFSFKPTAYCFLGFLANYFDHNLLKQFSLDLIEYFKDKNIKKMVIQPFIYLKEGKFSNQAIIKVLLEAGFNKADDLFVYEYDLNNEFKVELKNNVFFKTMVLDSNYDQLNRLVDQNSLNIYNAFKDYTTLYALQLDVYKSKRELVIEMQDLEKFVSTFKDDLKRSQDVLDANNRISNIRQNLSYLEKYSNEEKTFLVLMGLIKYADRYYVVFNIDNDEDGFFNGQELLLNDLIKDSKKDKIKAIYSLKQFKNTEIKELIGEFVYEY